MTVGAPVRPGSATGRSTQSTWTGLTRRVAYRSAVANGAVDVEADLADDVKVPPIDLTKSRLGFNNQIIAFLRLLTGATSVTVQLWVNVLDVVAGAVPADDETDWAFVEEVTVTRNTLFKFVTGDGGTGLVAGTYKMLVTVVATGGGTLDIHMQHTDLDNVS